LKDGRILITGGSIGFSPWWKVNSLQLGAGNFIVSNKAKIFDPKTNKFNLVKNRMLISREGHISVSLQNGDVFIIGGDKLKHTRQAELFIPSNN
jgi:hypothetical protein